MSSVFIRKQTYRGKIAMLRWRQTLEWCISKPRNAKGCWQLTDAKKEEASEDSFLDPSEIA